MAKHERKHTPHVEHFVSVGRSKPNHNQKICFCLLNGKSAETCKTHLRSACADTIATVYDRGLQMKSMQVKKTSDGLGLRIMEKLLQGKRMSTTGCLRMVFSIHTSINAMALDFGTRGSVSGK